MKEKDINKDKVNILIDNMISRININEKSDKKQVKVIKLMPEIKKFSDLVAKDPLSFEASIFCDGFIAGADWRINSIWHDDLKKGQTNRCILVRFRNGLFMLFEDIRELKGIEVEVDMFAYIDDLIPDAED